METSKANLNRQRGVVLVVSLVMLMVMTVLGVSAISTTGLEEKMAGNNRDYQLAFQAAEAALREGERLVETTAGLSALVDDDCTTGFCTTSRNDPAFNSSASYCDGSWIDERWVENICALNLQVWSTVTRHRQYITSIPEIQTNPKYIIEFIGYALRDPVGNPTPSTVAPTSTNWTLDWSEMYRVTAVGTGGVDTTQIKLQAVYKKDL